MPPEKKKKQSRPDQDTVPCPTCGGDGTVTGDRYTEPVKPCPTCKGAGVIPDEGDGA